MKEAVCRKAASEGWFYRSEWKLCDVVAFDPTLTIIAAIEIETTPGNCVRNFLRNTKNNFATHHVVVVENEKTKSSIRAKLHSVRARESLPKIMVLNHFLSTNLAVAIGSPQSF